MTEGRKHRREPLIEAIPSEAERVQDVAGCASRRCLGDEAAALSRLEELIRQRFGEEA